VILYFDPEDCPLFNDNQQNERHDSRSIHRIVILLAIILRSSNLVRYIIFPTTTTSSLPRKKERGYWQSH
jgi:hypothetical protein